MAVFDLTRSRGIADSDDPIAPTAGDTVPAPTVSVLPVVVVVVEVVVPTDGCAGLFLKANDVLSSRSVESAVEHYGLGLLGSSQQTEKDE